MKSPSSSFFFMQKHDGYAWPVVDHDNDKDMRYFIRIVLLFKHTIEHMNNGLLHIK